MPWDTSNSWTYAQISILWELSKEGKSLRVISERVGKNEDAIIKKAIELGILIEPTGSFSITKKEKA